MKQILLPLCLIPILLAAHPRTYTDVTLETAEGEIHLAYSLPKPLPEEGAPCVLVLDGLKTGREALQLVGDAHPYALVAYEYPPLVHKLWTPDFLLHPLAIRGAILKVPAEALDVIRWAEAQSWCGHKPIAVVGLSFGSVFVPAIYHRAKEEGITLGPGVLAYGGAGLAPLFATNLPVRPWLRRPLAELLSWMLHPLEPSHHTPHMKNGEFLIIYGAHDEKVPLRTARNLAELIPEPKTVVELDAGHLDPDTPEPLGETLRVTKRWLDETLDCDRIRAQTRSRQPPPS